MSMSLSISDNQKLFESFSSLNALTFGPSLRDSITKVWPEIERLSDVFAVTPFTGAPLAKRGNIALMCGNKYFQHFS